MSSENKERFPLRIQPETRRKIEQWYEADNCRSMNEFVVKAVNFYADYLAANDNNTLLPAAIQSAIDGRLGMFEGRLAKLLFKQAVELDMGLGLVTDCIQVDEEELRRRRGESVRNVKQTNGRLTFEQKVRQRDDDQWQD